MDFYQHLGPMAIGSRLRALIARITDDAAKLYALYGSALDPRWFPVVYVLAHQGPLTVGEIARIIGHSHASVSQILKAMAARGLTDSERSPEDRRQRLVSLNEQGRQAVDQMKRQTRDVSAAVDEILDSMTHDLWAALEEIELVLDQKSLFDRVARRFHAASGDDAGEGEGEGTEADTDPGENRADDSAPAPSAAGAASSPRAAPRVTVRDFDAGDAAAFASLNREWIERYFEVEAQDRRYLEDPEGTILEPGGHILMAIADAETVGTCALIAMDDGGFELAKMAVTPRAQGLGIGAALGRAVIARAREAGAWRVFLESNRRLTPALELYRKLGFVELEQQDSGYARSDIQMELPLDEAADAAGTEA